MRCFVARSPSVLGTETVVGLATEIYDPAGYSVDAFYLSLPAWTEEHEREAQDARRQFGVMKEPKLRPVSIDEFPSEE